MKVEKIREKDGKLELLVELADIEATEDLLRAAAAEIGKMSLDYKSDSGISPVDFLRGHLGQIETAFILDEDIMRRRAPFALSAARVDVIGSPVYRCSEHAEEGKPFKYQLVCVPVPEYELSSYGPVSITVPSTAVKQEEIDAELHRLSQTSLVPVADTSHDTVQRGDKVELSMETTKEGVRDETLCTDGREYATGTFVMPDAFDDGVVGMKVGETKTISYEGPELELDENGLPVMHGYESVVTIKRIVESRPAAIDDDWARSVKPGIESLEDLKDDIRKQVKARHEEDFQRTAEMLVGNELGKRLEGQISDLVYGVSVKEARDNLDAELRANNLTMDAYLKQQGMTQDQLSQALMMQVRQQLTRQLALNAYARHFNLNAYDEDLDAFFEVIAPGKANIAHQDFNRSGRMHAARCAALRLKASKHAVARAEVKRIGEGQGSADAAS